MLPLLLLLLTGAHSATAVSHSLKYFHTASSQVPNFPEFVYVGLVDKVEISRYDSNTEKAEPKQDWMLKANDQQYWERERQNALGSQQWFKVKMETLKQPYNQTGGVHILQQMSGCEWDDETGEVKGFDLFGYEGEDFLSLDLKTWTWVAKTPQSFITKLKLDKDEAELAQRRNYLLTECPHWLKKYLKQGRSSLMRTELPSMSLLQKSPSSPVRCHATGFYPDRAMLFWRKDGEELHEEVDVGEVLPNPDGTFQMSADLKVSSIPPEDWRSYQCVFQISGVNEDIVKTLDKDSVESNRVKPTDVTTIIIIAVALALVVALAAGGFFMYRKRNAKCASAPEKDPGSSQPLRSDDQGSSSPSETSS